MHNWRPPSDEDRVPEGPLTEADDELVRCVIEARPHRIPSIEELRALSEDEIWQRLHLLD